ncbi:MAG: hypothetical protein OXI46_08565 [Gemmatimonadota bacterium]|nr:hypothetical protein [Gemmatimonadota bacterium]
MQTLNLPSLQGGGSLQDVLESISDPLGNRPEYLVRHDLAGALIDTVAIFAGQATLTSGQGSGTGMSIEVMPVPFSPAPAATASAEGRVAATSGQYYEFSLHSSVGGLEHIVRLAEEPPVRTDAHLEAWVRGSARDRESPDDTWVEAALRRYEEMPMPERLLAWNSLLIADSGEIWARRFTIPDAETIPWDVFRADGSFLGQVNFSADLRIQHIDEGRLTVVSSDDLGVERALTASARRMPSPWARFWPPASEVRAAVRGSQGAALFCSFCDREAPRLSATTSP